MPVIQYTLDEDELDALASRIADKLRAELPHLVTPAPKPAPPSGFMTQREVAVFLRRGISTLERWRVKGTGPKWHRHGNKSVRYARADVVAWAEGKAKK